MLILKNWGISVDPFFGLASAYGNVYGHYRFEDGHRVVTSVIIKLWKIRYEGTYVIRTYSGSVYRLAAEYIDREYYDQTREIMGRLGIEIVMRTELEEILEEADGRMEKLREQNKGIVENAECWAKKEMNPNELYLIIDHWKTRKAIFMDYNRELHEIKPVVHVGMMQDSVLIRNMDKYMVDFRYFPRNGIEPYVWDKRLERTHIYNYGDQDFIFRVNGNDVVCEQGKVTMIERAE